MSANAPTAQTSDGVAYPHPWDYTGAAEIKGGSIAALKEGEVVRKGAELGRTFTVKFFTRDGQSVTRKLELRAERRGQDNGRPLGC